MICMYNVVAYLARHNVKRGGGHHRGGVQGHTAGEPREQRLTVWGRIGNQTGMRET